MKLGIDIRLGTRGSALAMVQARDIKRQLESAGNRVEIVVMSTIGDQDKTSTFATLGPPGVFVREIESALNAGAIDLAVHCYKDLPSVSPDGLVIAAIPGREDAREVLLVANSALDRSQLSLPLKPGAVVGTSAARRQAYIKSKRPDLTCRELRGNVPTRLAKLARGEYDAIVLAAAGINRLAEGAERGENEAPDVSSATCITMDAADFVPAPSQGALALQVREAKGAPKDQAIFDAVRTLHDESAERGVLAERELLRLIQAGCEAPFGAWVDAAPGSDDMTLHAIFAEDGVLRRVAVQGTDSKDIARRAFAELGLEGKK